MKLKSNVPSEAKKQAIHKILSLKSFNEKTELYHHAIITLRQLNIDDSHIAKYLESEIKDFCKTTFKTVLDKISYSKDESKKTVTGINFNCFRFIKDKVTENDLTFLQGKQKKNITIDELQYYLYRVTKKVFVKEGYSSDGRNYFTSTGFQAEYKSKTKRTAYKEKLATMNKILNKYDLITVHQQKKMPNLYVMGKQNPFYYMDGIMEPAAEAKVKQMIETKKLLPAKLTQSDNELIGLKQQIKEANATKSELNKQLKEADTTISKLNKQLQNPTPDLRNKQEDIDYLTNRNQELLDELSECYKNKNCCSICKRPNKKTDTFENDFKNIISGKRKIHKEIDTSEILSGAEYLEEVLKSYSKMHSKY